MQARAVRDPNRQMLKHVVTIAAKLRMLKCPTTWNKACTSTLFCARGSLASQFKCQEAGPREGRLSTAPDTAGFPGAGAQGSGIH